MASEEGAGFHETAAGRLESVDPKLPLPCLNPKAFCGVSHRYGAGGKGCIVPLRIRMSREQLDRFSPKGRHGSGPRLDSPDPVVDLQTTGPPSDDPVLFLQARG